MRSISLISKLTGVTNNIEASEITLNSPSIVELKAERADIASIVRTNNDMVITLRDGEVVTVKNFYAFADQGGNQLVLEDSKGALWWVQDTDTAFHFEPLNNIDDLMVATGAENHGGAAIWPWVLGGVALAGGIALAAGGGGGGGGGGDDNSNSGGSTGEPNPAPPGSDITPPAAPTNLNVSADGQTITGRAEPGSTVTITDANGQIIGQGTAGSDGSFSIPLTTPQINGEDVTVHATDPSGNTGPEATVTTPFIPEPLEPILTSVTDDTAPATGLILSGQPTNDKTPTIEGFALEGSTVHIFDNGVEIGTAVADANGSWSFTPGAPLADGEHEFTATATNPKGESGLSGSYTVVIDTVAPDAPTVSPLNDTVGSITGLIQNTGVTDDTKPTLSGVGEPGDIVTISDNGDFYTTVTVGSDGKWSYTPTQPLGEGSHTITLQQTDAAGNVSAVTTLPTFTVDLTPPTPATITNVSLDGTTINGLAEAGSRVTIVGANNVFLGETVTGADGKFAITITPAQTHGESLTAHIQDAAGNVGLDTGFTASNSRFPTVPLLDSVDDNAGATTGTLTSGQATDDTTPTLNGTAEAGSTVTIFLNGAKLGTALVDGTGHWTFTPTQPLPEGPQNLTFNATNIYGTSGTSSAFTVNVDTTPPSAPTDLLVTADGLHVTGSAEAGSKITVYDGDGNILATGVTGSDGKFDVTPLTSAQLNGETLLVTATDVAGNQSSNTSVPAPDTTAPAAPTDVDINDEGSIVTGNAEAGSTVKVTDPDGTVLGEGKSADDGSFSIPIAPPQTNGEKLDVSATDGAGNTGPETPIDAPDTTAPDLPIITTAVDDVALLTGNLANGDTTNDDRPELQGTAEANAIVTIYDNGKLLDRVTADENGNWSYTPGSALGQGLHNLTATATDAKGNTSGESLFTLTVDSIAPLTPAITLVSDNVGTITGPVANNGVTNDTTPTLSGTGEPGSKIILSEGENSYPAITVGSSGSWSFTPTEPLENREYHFTVTSTDAAGNVTAPSAEFVITVVTALPDAPTIDSADDNIGTVTAPLTNNSATDDTRPQFNGSGPAGTTVTLYDGANPIGTATVDDDGKWSITPAQPLSEGPHALSAIATDAAGNASPAANFNLTVDTTPPAAPQIINAAGLIGDAPATLINGGSTQSTTPEFSGKGEAGATIEIFDNGLSIGTAIVDENGDWTLTPDSPLSETTHSLTAIATDPAGNVGQPSPAFTLTVDNTPPVQPGIPGVVDDRAPGLGNVPADGFTNDTTPTITGTGVAGDTISIRNDGAEIGTATVLADGSWSYTLPTVTPPATYNITVVETDPAGNSSDPSENITFTVDTAASDAPVINLALDDVGNIEGEVFTTQTTDDSTPEFLGTGVAGDTITLYEGTTVLGRAVVDENGEWRLTLDSTLPDGIHNLTATATDPAGNISAPSNTFTITVDTTPLTAPSVTEIIDDDVPAAPILLTNGSATNDTTPTLRGTGTPGSTVSVFDNGSDTALATAVVAPDGTWSVTTPILDAGSHEFTFSATNPAGETATAADSITLTVDLTPPPEPVITLPLENTGTLVSGTSEPGSTVIIRDAGGVEIGRGVADSTTGAFTVTVSPAQTGGQSLSAIAQDPAGNQSAEVDFTASNSGLPQPPIISEVVDDVLPGTADVASGQSTNDTLPMLNGTATAFATVTLYVDGAAISPPISANNLGNWTYQFTTPLGDGPHTFAVSQTTTDFQTSGKSPDFVINIDTLAPTAPAITNVTDDVTPGTGIITSGLATNDPRPTFTGSGEIGSTITVLDNGSSIGTAVVNANGTWTFTPTADLTFGVHPITVTSTDTAGNVSAPSAIFAINVDTDAPLAPVVTAVTDDGTTPGAVISGQPTNDNTPTLTGTVEPNTTLTISDNGTAIATIPVDGTGNWSFTPNPPFADGSHNITLTATDAAGNISPPSAGFNVVVDTSAPIVPAITLVVDDQTQAGGVTLTNGQLTKDTLPTLSGTSEVNAIITLRDGNTVIGTTLADGEGKWSLDPTTALGQGSHTLTVTATDAAGNISNPSSAFTVLVDSTAPNAPVIVTVTDNTAPVLGPITNGQATNETRPALTGTGEIGSTISVYDGNNPIPIGTTTVGAGGNWSFTPGTPLSSGSHDLTVTATDSAGNTSAPSAIFNVLVDITAPVAPAITTVADDAGSVLGNLASGQTTDDTLPALSGTAEAGSTVTIYDNGTAIGTAVATGGAWNFTPTTALTNGSHALTVTATDPAGNVSAPSGAFNIVVDTTAPTAPIVIQAFDDVGPVTGALVNGQSTNDNQPLLSGTAEANSIVSISDNGVFLATVTASPTGTWSYTPPARLDDVHTFTATSTDAAGNLGAVSGSFTLNIDTSTPNTPVLTSVTDDIAGGVFNAQLTNGQITNDARPTLNGTAEAGTTLTIFDGATQIGTVTVPVGGNWTFTPTTPLTTGLHTLTVTATDAAGNASGATAGFAITVDTTAPTQPVITTIVDDAGPITGPITNLPTNDNLPTLNGTAEANSTVNIYDNGALYATVSANGSGNWNYTPTAGLADGSHSFTVTATDLAGNISVRSVPSAIIVDTTPPELPTGMAVNATGTIVTGTAEVGSTVTITTSTGTVLGSATADGTGKFSVAITPAQTNAQALLAYAVDVAGNTGLSAGFTAPNTALPGVPVITSVVDDFAAVTGTVANGQSTNDATPTINGTADIGATVNVYNNGVLMGTTTANGSGNWTYTPGSALGEGSHAFTATATNANGTGSPSAAATVIVDTLAPLAPTATVSADGTTISGSAEANSIVTITLPGGGTVTATTNGSGAWSATLPTREIGGESLSVIATDAAGNASPSISAIAPNLPLAADSNVVNLALTSTATVSPPVHYSDYGTLLVGALGNTASVLGNDTAQVTFNIATGGTGNITIDAAATGIVLTLLNNLEVAVQRFENGAWTTVYDSSLPQFANLLTLGSSGVTMNINGLTEGSYRVLSYNTSLVTAGSFTSLDVSVQQISAGTITGGTTQPGNVITDVDPNSGQDTAPAGTVVSSVTNAQGTITAVGAGGADIQGQYGILHINQEGSYTYTLTNTSASVIGRTENFTYTITHNGATASAQLVVTLGNPAPASTVTATDNTAALTYSTDVEAVNHGASSQSGLSVLSVGVGNVLNANLLANMSNPIIFDVDDGSTRTMTLQASVGGVALISTFDLYIYKFNEITQQFEQYQVQKTWLTAPLLGGTSGQLTLTLPGGEYLFLLNNASGVSVLTGYTLNILQDHTYAVESVSATTTGNVLQDDIVMGGAGHVTQVNGVSVAATGTTNINGEYGVLTIDANGSYTYKLNAGVGADSIKTPDSFVYTVTAPNGDTGTASLNITATPRTVDAIDDVSLLMPVSTAQTTAVYSDTSMGQASWTAKLLSATSGSGDGFFTVANNDVLHNPVLHFNVQSLLSLGGLNVTWEIINSAGTVVRSSSFNGGLLLGGVANIDLSGLDLPAGNYTLHYTGSMGALGAGLITITPTITGTTIDLDNYSTLAGSTVQGNIYDGHDAAGAVDQLGTVHTLLSITGYNGVTTTLNPLTSSNSSATIQGHYGTLVMGIDGSYTYTLNSGISPAAITSKETFNYTLNDQNGHSDSATLTINMNPQFVSTALGDVINGSAYGDTLVYHLLNSASATGGNGADTWSNFSLAQGDKIDIHDLLTGWNPATSNIANYLNVTTSGNNTVISIDRDGTGTTYSAPTTLVTLENVHTTLDELVQQNHIVT